VAVGVGFLLFGLSSIIALCRAASFSASLIEDEQRRQALQALEVDRQPAVDRSSLPHAQTSVASRLGHPVTASHPRWATPTGSSPVSPLERGQLSDRR